MNPTSDRTICFTCNKEKITYSCQGCSQRYCVSDLLNHRKYLSQQLDFIENEHDQLRQNLYDQKVDPTKNPLIKQIDEWEINSINKIKQMA